MNELEYQCWRSLFRYAATQGKSPADWERVHPMYWGVWATLIRAKLPNPSAMQMLYWINETATQLEIEELQRQFRRD